MRQSLDLTIERVEDAQKTGEFPRTGLRQEVFTMVPDKERKKQLRDKMIEHLEAAQAIADEIESGGVGYAIETALDMIRAENWPHLDPNLEVFRKGKKR